MQVAPAYIWVLVFIGVLGACALLWKIRSDLKLISHAANKEARVRQTHIDEKKNIVTSITVLCKLLLDEQVDIGEGCMRIKILIDHLDERLHQDKNYEIYSTVYELLAHMPRFTESSALTNREIRSFEKERKCVEKKYKMSVQSASRKLLAYLGAMN